jgi:hypothetical protein
VFALLRLSNLEINVASPLAVDGYEKSAADR